MATDLTYRFHLLRSKTRQGPILVRDAKTEATYARPHYSPNEMVDLCMWLNERESRYPTPPKLRAEYLRG